MPDKQVAFFPSISLTGSVYMQLDCCGVDWGTGLPVDVLALVAQGRDDLKAMRGVNKEWREGFELSVTQIRVGPEGPVRLASGTLQARLPVKLSLPLHALE